MEKIWEETLCNENGYELVVERTKFSADDDNITEVEIVEKEEEIKIDNESLINILKKFIKSYVDNKDSQTLKNWLVFKLEEEFPEKENSELEKEAEELIAGVNLGKEKYDLIKERRTVGITPSDILAKDIAESTLGKTSNEVKDELRETSKNLEQKNIKGIYNITKKVETIGKVASFNKLNRYFENINEVIADGNEKMVNSLLTKAGNINQNPQLDGFIFEQFHENTFNIDAAIKDIHNVRAEALVPKDGMGYGKSSVDLVVKLKKNGIETNVKKYQAKLSDNPEALFKKGNYKFQRRLYGEGHENIGNTKVEYEGIESVAVSKSEMKRIQTEVQKGNLEISKQSFEKNIDVKALSKQIGKQALLSGTIAVGVEMTMFTGLKIIQGEEIKAEEVIIDGLKVGGSVGVSTAIAGGIKTAVEKKIIKGTAAKILKNNNIVGTIAFSALSLVGIMATVGSGEMSLKDGMKEIGGILAGTYGGIKGSIIGAGMAAGVIASVGVILAPVVAAIAGTIGYFVGSTIASNIAKGATTIATTITSTLLTVAKAGYNTVKGIASGVSSVVKGTVSVVSNFCSLVGSLF